MTEIGKYFEEKEEMAVALTKAKDLVGSVDRLSLNGNFSHEEACRLLGIPEEAYDVAKKYIEENTEKKKAV